MNDKPEHSLNVIDFASRERGGAGGKSTTDVLTSHVPPPDPAVLCWVADNPWFNQDGFLHAFSMIIESRLIVERPALSVSERLEAVAREVRAHYPERIGAL